MEGEEIFSASVKGSSTAPAPAEPVRGENVMIGQSAAFKCVCSGIEQVAPTGHDCPYPWRNRHR
jgi:hypothetical protein